MAGGNVLAPVELADRPVQYLVTFDYFCENNYFLKFKNSKNIDLAPGLDNITSIAAEPSNCVSAYTSGYPRLTIVKPDQPKNLLDLSLSFFD
jgi:hypothetical protein